MIIKTDNQNYFNIANAIREKNKTTETYKPSEMALAIANIKSDSIPCTLTVETAEGAAVIATLDGTTVSATAGTDGMAILILEKEGLWTISATYEGETKSTEILVEHNIEESLPFFPNEPSAYNQLALITSSQTWTAPEDGYFQIEVFGASGKGGAGKSYCKVVQYEPIDYAASGGGGGGGGYACSRIKMKKGDTIELVVGAVGTDSSAIIDSAVETYDIMTVTSGANGGNVSGSFTSYKVGTGGTGGVASGGNYANANGGAGGDGKKSSTAGGAGGTAGYTGGNAGGTGGYGQTNYTSKEATHAGKSGKAGFINIYRGDTNVVA